MNKWKKNQNVLAMNSNLGYYIPKLLPFKGYSIWILTCISAFTHILIVSAYIY
jgi:hypothetical protein